MRLEADCYDYLNKTVWGYRLPTLHTDEEPTAPVIPEKGMICCSNREKDHDRIMTRYQKEPEFMPLLYFVPFKKYADTELAWSRGRLRRHMTITDSEESAWECLINDTKDFIKEQKQAFNNAIILHALNMNALKKSNAYRNGRIFPDECLQAQILEQGCNEFMNFVKHTDESFQTLYEYLVCTYNSKY